MRPITLIVIHCSASPNHDSLFRGSPGTPGQQTPVMAINQWHRSRGFKRDAAAYARLNPALDAIGYHYVLYRNGALATNRREDETGAHVSGHNLKSLGLCLVGTDCYIAAQWMTLRVLVESLQQRLPGVRVVGHRDLSPDANNNGLIERDEWLKTCPGFDVAAWLRGGMVPLTDALQED